MIFAFGDLMTTYRDKGMAHAEIQSQKKEGPDLKKR
jgi:hypothetical protein